MNTNELRDALADQERFAPQERAVLDELATLTRPRRHLSGWATGLLAAAAVVGIVATVATLAGPTAPTSGGTTTVAATTVTPTAALVPVAQDTSASEAASLASGEAQAQRDAEQAMSSAEAAANMAASAASKANSECNATIKSHSIVSLEAVDPVTIRAVVSGCVNAWGPVGGYTAEWVPTTLGKLQTLSTGHLSRAATPLVAIQVHAVFTKGGQSAPAETMLIRLFAAGTPSGVDVPVNPVDLAKLGVVHQLG